MPALETLHQLRLELQKAGDHSLPPEAKNKLLPLLDKYDKAARQNNFKGDEFHLEFKEIYEKFHINHPGLFDMVNVISGLGI